MKFDPQEGYVDTGFRRAYMPLVSVYDHASKEMRQVRLDDAYEAGVPIEELNVTPITRELLEAVQSSLDSSAWDTDCQRVMKNHLRSIIRSHLIAATEAPDPFVYIASFAYQAARLAPEKPESAERFYKYLARVVTVYLKSHGYYMPDKIYPLLFKAIETTSATKIDKVVKGLHIQIPIGSLDKYINSYVQLNDGKMDITSNKRIAIDHAIPLAEQLSVTNKNSDKKKEDRDKDSDS
ncbi:hypothetical protein [Idiomarina sp. OXR-189]|uniref:hypothetical protein n=1 Tax=Idiomarina sp. OXR-189 TaxID=3100175 RepID=UPI002AC89B96|nr:hypothetical protein [Idiomarina sp. OXR-189]WPZ00154.1 hypothetical protein UM402_06500 [Idiomarina sp. OXR-189]